MSDTVPISWCEPEQLPKPGHLMAVIALVGPDGPILNCCLLPRPKADLLDNLQSLFYDFAGQVAVEP